MHNFIFYISLCVLLVLGGMIGNRITHIEKSFDTTYLQKTTGRYLKGLNNTHLLIAETAVLHMEENEKTHSLFKHIHNGDLIEITHGPIQENFPSKTTVTQVKFIQKGSPALLPTELIYQLIDLGWLPQHYSA